MPEIDDFKFVGALLALFGLFQLAVGVSDASAIGLHGDLRPLLLMGLGSFNITAGFCAFKKRW